MKKFIIERNFPGAANMSIEELQDMALTACEAVQKLERPYTWVQSYITEDKLYCIHIAESKEMVREHARIAKFPINIISEVKTIIDPTYANPLQVA